MARRVKTSPAEDIVAIASKLPWWGALSLAAVSYFGLHAYATQPIAITTAPGQIASAMLPMVFKGLATAGQYILPLLFAVAALLSWIKANKSSAKPGLSHSANSLTAQSVTQHTGSCPLCAASMVLRSAKKGSNAGKTFWGCSNYPRCKGTRPAD